MLSTGCRQAAIILIYFGNLVSNPTWLASLPRLLEPVNLQVLLTNLCQDSSLDIVLRLQLLEVIFLKNGSSLSQVYFVLQVIELRSLGWKKNPTVEKYYKERSP